MSRRPSDNQIVDALVAATGKVCLAAERLGCPPEALYARARKSPRVRATIRFFRGKLLDAAETALWKGILDGESWAVRLALTEWGRSRDFSDGAEAWHSAHAGDEPVSDELVRKTVVEVLNQHDYVENRRARRCDPDAGPVCGPGERGPVEDGAPPGGDRPRDRGDDLGEIGADPGD